MRSLIPGVFAATVALSISGAAMAQDEGVPVTVRVVKQDGTPLPTASIRHPQEAERHPVNAATGEWTESILYMPDGSEFLFTKGTILQLEISAPGYVNYSLGYEIKKRKNLIIVPLQQMAMDEEDEGIDDPVIQFGRDKPIE